MDRLEYGCCTFHVKWAGMPGAYVASVDGLSRPLSAEGQTKWEAYAELNRRLHTRLEQATERAIMGEVRV